MGSPPAVLAAIPILVAAMGSETQRDGLFRADRGAATTQNLENPLSDDLAAALGELWRLIEAADRVG